MLTLDEAADQEGPNDGDDDDLLGSDRGSWQSMTCFNALADDDNEPGDNRTATTAFRVK